eukprot:39774-Eustigmatos_ZCMA.PRE.1
MSLYRTCEAGRWMCERRGGRDNNSRRRAWECITNDLRGLRLAYHMSKYVCSGGLHASAQLDDHVRMARTSTRSPQATSHPCAPLLT